MNSNDKILSNSNIKNSKSSKSTFKNKNIQNTLLSKKLDEANNSKSYSHTKSNTIRNANKNNELNNIAMFKDLELSDNIKSIIIKEAFRMFDSDQSGEIDKKEFRKLVQSLGLEVDIRKIDELMKQVDKNGSGNIDIEEFTEMMLNYQFNRQVSIVTHLSNTFSLYDKDEDGVISEDDLIKVGMELDELTSPDEALMLINLSKMLMPDKITNNNEINELNNNVNTSLKESNFADVSNYVSSANSNKNIVFSSNNLPKKYGITKDEFINLLLNTKFLKDEECNDNLNTSGYKKNNSSSMSIKNDNTNRQSYKTSKNVTKI